MYLYRFIFKRVITLRVFLIGIWSLELLFHDLVLNHWLRILNRSWSEGAKKNLPIKGNYEITFF